MNWTSNIKHSSIDVGLNGINGIRKGNININMDHRQIFWINVNQFNTLIDCCYAFLVAQFSQSQYKYGFKIRWTMNLVDFGWVLGMDQYIAIIMYMYQSSDSKLITIHKMHFTNMNYCTLDGQYTAHQHSSMIIIFAGLCLSFANTIRINGDPIKLTKHKIASNDDNNYIFQVKWKMNVPKEEKKTNLHVRVYFLWHFLGSITRLI